ncbi:MAG: hypothetical protein IPG38_16395 [Chitinophagaceae bacterium]|nr:hypothetical protein [Chitinophagaceae bacterium]
MNNTSPHTFHIPVMGLAFTVDSPIKVARFGITSVISIVENRLIEMMRRQYYPAVGKEYQPITPHEDDFRARRITDYLNLVNTIVEQQVEKLRSLAFEAGSEIVKYFEMLPEESKLKPLFSQMMKMGEGMEKFKLAEYLRTQIRAGSIDVNIMTKTDRNNFNKAGELMEDGSDAVVALRGYAKSDLTNSSVIFSAGTNLRLYNYLENCPGFEVNADGGFTKKVVIKVSDYRSAFIQGKYLAKKGIWVSEFRIESGLNCGGHAFATDGYLLGPILEEFKIKKQELTDALFELYNKALLQKTNRKFVYPPELNITVQGGIGTHAEDDFLREHYKVAGTGWGTPFLLVPEATTVDEDTLKLLCAAKEDDVLLSKNSPFGVRLYYLKGTSADKEKLARIESGKPGSPCTEKHLAFNTEFTKEPICTASHKYQQLKIAQLQSLHLAVPEYNRQLNEVLDKECLCVGLSNAASINYAQPFVKKLHAVNICPGPNIVNFSELVSLQTMVDHIYGRRNILANAYRPHMFITELNLYINYLKEQLEHDFKTNQLAERKKYYVTFFKNLQEGILYYRQLQGISPAIRKLFINQLNHAGFELELLHFQYPFINQ